MKFGRNLIVEINNAQRKNTTRTFGKRTDKESMWQTAMYENTMITIYKYKTRMFRVCETCLV